MSIKFQSGNLTEFFNSAKNTAIEIDKGKKVTPKHTIWVEPADLIPLLKPERRELVKYLRGRKKILFTKIVEDMRRNAISLNRDLDILSKYHLIRTTKEINPGHGQHKVVEPLFGKQLLEFKVKI